MNRLTTETSIMGRKHDIKYGLAAVWKRKIKNDKYELIEEVVDKLGELEDIEEGIGVDLIMLFKVLKNGFYSKYNYYAPYCNTFDLETKRIFVNDYDVHLIFDFKDYGKEWALTREEIKYV